jgi:uncharacterized membrane protein
MKKQTLVLTICALLSVTFSTCNKPEYEIFGSVYGIVSDSESGELLENATVTLSPGGKSTTTGTDGRYEFADLEPKQYTITVQKNGYQTNRKTVTAIVDVQSEANIPLTKNK